MYHVLCCFHLPCGVVVTILDYVLLIMTYDMCFADYDIWHVFC